MHRGKVNHIFSIATIVCHISFAVVLSIFLLIPVPAMAYTTSGSKWSARSQTVSFYQTSVKGNYLSGLRQAAANYNASTDARVTLTATLRGGKWSAIAQNYGATGWEGQSTWYKSGGVTTKATSKVNIKYAASFNAARMKVLWLHELGHVWGLGHVSSIRHVMYTSASAAYLNGGVRSLTSDEIAGINKLY